MKSRSNGQRRALVISLIVFILLFSVAAFIINRIGNISDNEQRDMVRDAVRNAVLTCYAVEGAYPIDLDHLVENYGLAYDESRYLITYEAFASNIFPEIRVNIRGGE